MKTAQSLLFAFITVLTLIVGVSANASSGKTDTQNGVAVTSTVEHARATKTDTSVIDINTADAKALQTLKGVGSKRAQEIITYRTQKGGFKLVDDLAQVKGIGEKRLAQLLKNNPGRIVVKSAK